jgi:hypothetical protein
LSSLYVIFDDVNVGFAFVILPVAVFELDVPIVVEPLYVVKTKEKVPLLTVLIKE